MAKDNVPVTIISSTGNGYVCLDEKILPWPEKHPECFYLLTVVDRKDLSVVANDVCSDWKTVPASVKKYDNNKDYLLFVATRSLITNMYPQGDFYDFLKRNGAGVELDKSVQVCRSVDSATNYYNYCLASVMGKSKEGIGEGQGAYSIYQGLPLAMPMRLLLLGDQYTPVADFNY